MAPMSESRALHALRLAPRLGGLLASPARNLILGLIYMVGVMTVTTIAYVLAGWSLGDAVYMVIITVYTVGYDEVHPITTPLLRTITISTILFGCTGAIFMTGALVQFITLNQLTQFLGLKRMTAQIDKLSDHVIICGFGRIGVMLAQGLSAGRAAFVVLELKEERVEHARSLGYLCLQADATEESALQEAGVTRARTLATVLPLDAANVFITLSARSMNPELEIIARGEAPSTESKLRHAGANHVVLPAHIGAERIAEIIMYQDTARAIRDSEEMRAFDRVLQTLGLNMEVVTAAPGSPAVGMSIENLERAAEGALFVVQLNRRDEEPVMRPEAGMRIEGGDGLVVLGRVGGALSLFEPGTGLRRSTR
jgi:Trk K+ transport system NAD-binding subunit